MVVVERPALLQLLRCGNDAAQRVRFRQELVYEYACVSRF